MQTAVDSGAEQIKALSAPLNRSKTWMKLTGVVMIVMAVLSILGSFGLALIVAWIPIWQGVLLFQAANAVEQAQTSGDSDTLMRAMDRLKVYFIIMGVLVLIMLAFWLLGIIFGLGMGIMGASQIGGEMGNVPMQ